MSSCRRQSLQRPSAFGGAGEEAEGEYLRRSQESSNSCAIDGENLAGLLQQGVGNCEEEPVLRRVYQADALDGLGRVLQSYSCKLVSNSSTGQLFY